MARIYHYSISQSLHFLIPDIEPAPKWQQMIFFAASYFPFVLQYPIHAPATFHALSRLFWLTIPVRPPISSTSSFMSFHQVF